VRKGGKEKGKERKNEEETKMKKEEGKAKGKKGRESPVHIFGYASVCRTCRHSISLSYTETAVSVASVADCKR